MVSKKSNELKTCVFFSTVYPYETTLKNEFNVMSNEFDIIYYFPTSIKKDGVKLNLPSNVVLCDSLSNTKDDWKNKQIGTLLKALFFYLLEAFKSSNFKSYILNFKSYFSILLRNLNWANELEKFIRSKQLENALFYDYWFENSTLALAILKKQGTIKNVISRSHRFDLYDESWGENGKVPFRDFKVSQLNSVYTVAEHGQNYFKSKLKESLKDKIKLSYLGVSEPLEINTQPVDKNNILIVSASNTRNFKRVDLIPKVLSEINKPIRWVHFGSGPMDEIVKKNMNTLPANVQAEFKGFVSNKEVLSFFANNKVSVFLSLSTSEGLPISMMESITYGIPIFACNVCGIPELINELTGSMFNIEDDPSTIARKLDKQLEKDNSPKKISEFALNKFNYKNNYYSFYKDALNEK